MSTKLDLGIYKSGVVADLTCSRWGARTKLSEEDLGLENVSDLIVLGNKKLIHKEEMEKIDSVVGEARGFLVNNSFAFPFGNARFIPYSCLEKVVSKMNECGEKFRNAVEELLAKYEPAREEMLEEYDKVFERILTQRNNITSGDLQEGKRRLLTLLSEKYPSLPELRKKFGFEFVLFEIDSPNFENISSGDALDKIRISKEMEQAYKERVEEKMDGFLQEVISSLKEMVLEIVEKLKERIEKGSVGLTTVKSFKKFAESFRGLDFVDLDIDDAISSLEGKLDGASKSDLDDAKFQDKLKVELDDIGKLATSVDVSKVLGCFKRKLRIER